VIQLPPAVDINAIEAKVKNKKLVFFYAANPNKWSIDNYLDQPCHASSESERSLYLYLDRAFCEDRASKGYKINQPDSMRCMAAYQLNPDFPLADEPFVDENWGKDETQDVHLLGGYTGSDSGSVRLAAVYLLCREDKKAQGPVTRKRTVKTKSEYARGAVDGNPSFGLPQVGGRAGNLHQSNIGANINYIGAPPPGASTSFTLNPRVQGIPPSQTFSTAAQFLRVPPAPPPLPGADDSISMMASSVESVGPRPRRAEKTPASGVAPPHSARRTQQIHRSAPPRRQSQAATPARDPADFAAPATQNTATQNAFDVNQMSNMMEQMFTAINTMNDGQLALRSAVEENAANQNRLQEQVRTGFLAAPQSPRRRSRDEDDEEEVNDSDSQYGLPANARQRYDTDANDANDSNVVEDDGSQPPPGARGFFNFRSAT
jgi:hypothetical protein